MIVSKMQKRLNACFPIGRCKMRIIHIIIVSKLFYLFFFVSFCSAQTLPSVVSENSLVIKLSEGVYKIGTVVLDQDKKLVQVPGAINMQKGVIEYLAVARGGKTHESVLVLDIEPIHLQTALLLLGLEGGQTIEFQGDFTIPRGDPVEIWVEWKDPKGKTKKIRGEDLVYNLAEKKTMPRLNWVFTGSRIIDSVFAAQVERSIVATYHDPHTIIDNPLPTGADDTLYEVNEKLTPKVGTPVVMIVKAVKKSKNKID